MPSEEFGRWAQRARLALPMPLSAAPAARHDLDLDELVGVTAGTTKDPARGVPHTAREALQAAEPLLRRPALSLYAVRVITSGEERHVVGLMRGRESVVIIDTPTTRRSRSSRSRSLRRASSGRCRRCPGGRPARGERAHPRQARRRRDPHLGAQRRRRLRGQCRPPRPGVWAAVDCRAAGVLGAIRFIDSADGTTIASDPDPPGHRLVRGGCWRGDQAADHSRVAVRAGHPRHAHPRGGDPGCGDEVRRANG